MKPYLPIARPPLTPYGVSEESAHDLLPLPLPRLHQAPRQTRYAVVPWLGSADWQGHLLRLGSVLALILLALTICGCSSVSSVGLSGGATSQGDYSGSVQIYFRDEAGKLVTARVPRSSLPTTNAWPVTSNLDVPAGQTLPVIP